MIKKLIKKIIIIQHRFLPIPLFFYKNLFRTKLLYKIFYKYYSFIHSYDLPTPSSFFPTKEVNDNVSLKKYWLSKRSLYWHYAHFYINRYDKTFKRIYQKHRKIFTNKKLCDPMAGLGAIYLLNKLKLNITFIDQNKYCCEFLRIKFPQNKVFNEDWSYIKTMSDDIDTLISVSSLVYLDENEIEYFFKITKNIKNFVIIAGSADQDRILLNGLKYWDVESRLKKYNNHYHNSKIYIEKNKKIFDETNHIIYDSFLMIGD